MSTTIFELFSTSLKLFFVLWVIWFFTRNIIKRWNLKSTFKVYDQTLSHYASLIGSAGLAFMLTGLLTSAIKEGNKAFMMDYEHSTLIILILIAALVGTVLVINGVKNIYEFLFSLGSLITGRIQNNTEYKLTQALNHQNDDLIIKYYLKLLDEHPTEIVKFSDETIFKIADSLLSQHYYQDAKTLISSIKKQND